MEVGNFSGRLTATDFAAKLNFATVRKFKI